MAPRSHRCSNFQRPGENERAAEAGSEGQAIWGGSLCLCVRDEGTSASVAERVRARGSGQDREGGHERKPAGPSCRTRPFLKTSRETAGGPPTETNRRPKAPLRPPWEKRGPESKMGCGEGEGVTVSGWPEAELTERVRLERDRQRGQGIGIHSRRVVVS